MNLRHLASEPNIIPMPLPQDWILDGEPSPEGAVLIKSPDGSQCSGLWSCGKGRFRYEFKTHETAHILEGVAEIEEAGGESYTIRAGDVVHFPRELSTIWSIREPIRKIFFLVQ